MGIGTVAARVLQQGYKHLREAMPIGTFVILAYNLYDTKEVEPTNANTPTVHEYIALHHDHHHAAHPISNVQVVSRPAHPMSWYEYLIGGS